MKAFIKIASFLIFFFGANLSFSQNYLIDKKGTTTFFSDALIEDITATSNASMGIIDTVTHKVAVSILMTSFEFKLPLMQEHFNENYVESEKYPKATFSGQLSDSPDWNENGVQELTAKGKLTIHGKTKPLDAKIVFQVSDQHIEAKTTFDVALEDFNVEIPQIMFNKIAEVVQVTSTFSFKK
ncbi:YceI family protein [Flammeovirga aprica]|uniref:YceI family protein n=1 Tax=Flammeovirga aprica JL-4 TaxID=694437 RepID=A0A7X9S157_9BACT|nr:YceI family protein [Flammeovirga aprica]NME72411.1 YceI family protein [Flammeovirga aprica JL-4]